MYFVYTDTHLSFYCSQQWDHAIKTTSSTNICTPPEKEFFFLLFGFFIGTFLGVTLFPQGSSLVRFWDLPKCKMTSVCIGCISTEQPVCAFLAAHITHSLPHKPWSQADNDVRRWPPAKPWSWKKWCYSLQLCLHLNIAPASHLGILHT